MMHWLIYAGMMILGSALFHIFSKFSDGHIHPLYAAVFVQAAGFVGSLVLFFLLGGAKHISLADHKGIFLAICAGLVIGLANFSVFYMYKAGAPISLAVPLTRTAVAALAIIAGLFLFSETLTPVRIVGIALSFLSIFLMTR